MCLCSNVTLILNVLPKSVCSILEDIRKQFDTACSVQYMVFYIFIYISQYILFPSEKDVSKWEELLSHSLGLRYL